jgi:hypothetical protein
LTACGVKRTLTKNIVSIRYAGLLSTELNNS